MKTDFYDAIERQLVRDEGLRLKPYLDSVGKLSIGVGRNLDDNGITEAEAFRMLRTDVLTAESEAGALKCYRGLNDARKAVLVNMVFNLGIARFLGFRNMIAALNEGDFERAAAEMLNSKWASQVHDRARRLSEQMRKGEWVS